MAETKQWPFPLNQAGYPYPAQFMRAQHYAATSGGNGVSSPGALRVTAQPAPDGTIQIVPGGADVVSTYDPEQSYHVQAFQPLTVTVPQTGSASGGRHDLVVLRVLDPEFESHPDHSGEMTEEAAQGLDFWWIEVVQGTSPSSFNPSYPHVVLARIMRGPNQTIVTDDDIVDLRELANPQNQLHMRGNNLISDDTESLHTGSAVWPTDATHTVRVPKFATTFHALAHWNNIRYAHTAMVQGIVRVFIVHPDGSEISTQQQSWRKSHLIDRDRFDLVLSDGNIRVPEKFRGEVCRVEMRGTKTGGPNVYMDGNSSWSMILNFEQEIA